MFEKITFMALRKPIVGNFTTMHHTMQHFTNYHCKHVLRTFSTTIKPSPMVSSPVRKARNIQESIRKQTQVSITLATYLFKNPPNDNIVFSPLSIQVVLGLIAAGCRGETQDQVLSFLQTTSIHDVNALYSQLVSSIMADGSPFGGPCLSLPNGLWVEQTFSLKDSFKQIVDKIYKAKSEQVNFLNEATEVTKIVNAWAKDQTNGLIKEILSPDAVNRDTRLIFANAVYFKGVWNKKFDPSKTKDYKFHLGDGSKVKVPFMTSSNKQFVGEYDDFKVLRLPYLQGKDNRLFSMYIFLPDEKDGLPSLIQKFSSQSEFLEHHIPRQLVKVGRFLIPKFKLLFEFKASKMMKELGLILPFKYGRLTEMVNEPVYVSEIFHKAFVEVNEEGTEAAAVTGAVISITSVKPRPYIVDFVADHPFMFVIREDTSGAVMFMGQVVNPNRAVN